MTPSIRRAPRWRKRAAPRIALAASIALTGCASYAPRPLDAAALSQALAERAADHPDIAAEAAARGPYDPSDGLDLGEAELLCLVLNPTLRAARLRANVAVAGAGEAGRWEDPEIDADLLRVLDADDHPWIFGSALSFTIPISGRLGVERAVATAEGRLALAEAWGAEQDALRDLRTSWAEWRSAERSRDAVEETRARLASLADIADQLADAGELRLSEAAAFRAALAEREIELASRDAEASAARLAIHRQLGLAPRATVELVGGAEIDEPPAKEFALESVAARGPEPTAKRFAYEVAEESLRLEVRKQYPDLHLGPAYEREDGEDKLGVGLSIPLLIFNGNKRAIVEAEAGREAARAEWEAAAQSALFEAEEARGRLAAALLKLDAARGKLAPLARRGLDEARRLAEAGELDTALLLDAIEADERARLAIAEAEAEAAKATADLRALAPADPFSPSPVDPLARSSADEMETAP